MVYIPLLFIILYCIFKYDVPGKRAGINGPYLLVLIYLILLSGLAYRIGGDGIVFENEYPLYKSLLDPSLNISYFFSFQNRMPGWVLLNTICKTFSSSWVLFKIVHAILVNSLILQFIRKNCRYVFTVILFYFILLYFNFNFQYLRASIAVAVFLSSLKFYYKKEWLKYYLVCGLAFTFHDSALVTLFLPLLSFWNYSKKQVIAFLIVTAILIILRGILIEKTLTLFTNEYVAMRVGYYVSQYETDSSFSLYLNLAFNILLPMALIFMLRKHQMDNKLTILSIAYMAVYVLSMVFPIAYRLNNFFILFYYILIIDSLGDLFLNHSRRLVVGVYIVLCFSFILFKARTYLTYYGQTTVPSYVQFYPYSSVFDQTKYPDREKILDDAQTGIY